MKFMVYFTTEMHKAVKETRDAMKGTVKAGKALQSRKRKGLNQFVLITIGFNFLLLNFKLGLLLYLVIISSTVELSGFLILYLDKPSAQLEHQYEQLLAVSYSLNASCIHW